MLCQLLLFLLLAFDQSRKRIYTFYILGFKPSAGNTSGRHSIFTFYKHISCKMGPRTPRAHSQFQKWFENDLISMRERRYEYPASESQTFSTFSARANKMAVQTSLARGWATCNACLAWSYVHYFMFNISKYYKNKKKISFLVSYIPLDCQRAIYVKPQQQKPEIKNAAVDLPFYCSITARARETNWRKPALRTRPLLSFLPHHNVDDLWAIGASAISHSRPNLKHATGMYIISHTRHTTLEFRNKKNIRRLHISQPTTGTHIKTKSFASVSFSAFHPTTPTVFVILCLDSFVHVSG